MVELVALVAVFRVLVPQRPVAFVKFPVVEVIGQVCDQLVVDILVDIVLFVAAGVERIFTVLTVVDPFGQPDKWVGGFGQRHVVFRQHDVAKHDRGGMSFAHRPHAHYDTHLAALQSGLVQGGHYRGIEEGRRLDTVLVGKVGADEGLFFLAQHQYLLPLFGYPVQGRVQVAAK